MMRPVVTALVAVPANARVYREPTRGSATKLRKLCGLKKTRLPINESLDKVAKYKVISSRTAVRGVRL